MGYRDLNNAIQSREHSSFPPTPNVSYYQGVPSPPSLAQRCALLAHSPRVEDEHYDFVGAMFALAVAVGVRLSKEASSEVNNPPTVNG